MGRRQRITFPRMEVELADPTRLPPRRGQVLELAAQGMNGNEIAEILSISRETVVWHLDELKDQLCAFSRTDLISQGWMHGLLRARAGARAVVFVLALLASLPMARPRTNRSTTNRPASSAMRIGRREISSIRA